MGMGVSDGGTALCVDVGIGVREGGRVMVARKDVEAWGAAGPVNKSTAPTAKKMSIAATIPIARVFSF